MKTLASQLGMSPAVAKQKLMVALDFDPSDNRKVRRFVDGIRNQVFGVKVGLGSFTRLGPKMLLPLQKAGLPIFLDLKFHDIPHTVAMAVGCIMDIGVFMFTVHTSGGAAMMKACREVLERRATATRRPLMMGVTILTSEPSDEKELRRRARLAYESGCDGVICSALDLPLIRQECGTKFLAVTPGLRLSAQGAHDQVRIATPVYAIEQGADYLVMGRPVLEILGI